MPRLIDADALMAKVKHSKKNDLYDKDMMRSCHE